MVRKEQRAFLAAAGRRQLSQAVAGPRLEPGGTPLSDWRELPFGLASWSQQVRAKFLFNFSNRVPYKAELNEHDRNHADVA